MKTLKYLLLLLTLATPAALLAQDNPPPAGAQGQMAHHMPSVDDQVDHLSSKLNLTDDQKAKIKPILQDQQDQMSQLMSNPPSSREETRAKMRDIHQKSSAKIRALLTDDQKAQFDKMQAERHGHMGHGGDQGAPPPQQE